MINRRMLARGKRLDNDEMVYGYYLYDAILDVHVIWTVHEHWIIDPETVGQSFVYYGLELFDGDVIAIPCHCDSEYGCSHGDGEFVVEWDKNRAGYALKLNGSFNSLDDFDAEDMHVIGNIHDHPHLLEGSIQ